MLPLTRSRNRARFFGIPFSPSALFEGGTVPGAWYDPSDLSTMFNDAAGTQPITSFTTNQPVGLLVDKSGRGNNATASGSARPVLSKRYNLLTRTEEFNDVVWTKTNITVDAIKVTDPLGGTTAQQVFETTANGRHRIVQTYAASASSVTLSVYAKNLGGRNVNIEIQNLTNGAYAYFNVTTGALVSSGVYGSGYTIIGIPSATNVGNGWWKLSLVTTIPTATISVFVGADNGTEASYVGDVTKGFIAWGADLRRTIDANAFQPAYQRVVTATDYDGDGFLPYLEYSGAQAMATGSVDFSATDAMTVFSGLTKLSDAAQAAVVELSATIASNNGTFLLAAPDGATQTFGWDSKGTAQVDAVASSLAAPRTAVLTGTADISDDSCILRVNGAQADSDTGDQGTGNYGNYPLNIGARNNGGSLPFTGRMYSLIVRGAQSSAAQISATESWVAQRTGVAL